MQHYAKEKQISSDMKKETQEKGTSWMIIIKPINVQRTALAAHRFITVYPLRHRTNTAHDYRKSFTGLTEILKTVIN